VFEVGTVFGMLLHLGGHRVGDPAANLFAKLLLLGGIGKIHSVLLICRSRNIQTRQIITSVIEAETGQF